MNSDLEICRSSSICDTTSLIARFSEPYGSLQTQEYPRFLDARGRHSHDIIRVCFYSGFALEALLVSSWNPLI